MTSESVHNRKRTKRYNVLLIPDDGERKTWNANLSLTSIALLIALSVLVVAVVVTLLLAYTPLNRLIVSSTPAEYMQQLAELQRRVERVTQETLALREYNLKLRTALGDRSAVKDSSWSHLTATNPLITIEDFDKTPNSTPRTSDQKMSTEYDVLGVSASSPAGNSGLLKFDTPVTFPVDGYITRGYEAGIKHYGIDIAGKIGTAIYAAADGYVVFAGWTYNDGYMMIIAHGNSYLTVYKHNQSLLKSLSAYVKRGEPVALLGNSGKTSLGPHLHFEIWKDGIPRDPSLYLLH